MKTLVVFGTRPEIIKLSPLIQKLGQKKCSTVFTGQHYDFKMSMQFIEQLELPVPDYSLKISKTPSSQISDIILQLSKILSYEKPDTVIVQGDTNTVLASSICSIKNNIPISHVESGLRSYDWRMPEEHNRIAVDHLSEILFAPTKYTKNNLISEKVHGKIYVTGNTVIDAVNKFSKISKGKSTIEIKSKQFILMTLHRTENVDYEKTLKSIVGGVLDSELDFIFPLHPRTKKRLKEFGLFNKIQNSKKISLIDGVGYFEMLELMKKCSFIFSDSGGIQEEATADSIRKKVIVARKTTDRQESITSKTSELVNLDSKSISKTLKRTWNSPDLKSKKRPFGNGKTSEKIIKLLKKNF